MPDIAHTAQAMVSGMAPVVRPGIFVFVTTNEADLIATLVDQAIATFREDEGLSLLVPVQAARDTNQNLEDPMRCITLNVYSSLQGVGLTAAVATALGDNAIPCNMIAAFHHDHVFVPAALCDQALAVLINLQKSASQA